MPLPPRAARCRKGAPGGFPGRRAPSGFLGVFLVTRAERPTQHTLVPPPSRRGLSRVEAAAYIGVSPSTFDRLVNDKQMPAPKRVYSRIIWDVRALDLAFEVLGADYDQVPSVRLIDAMREGTMRIRLRYVIEDVDRHGNVRLYFRRKGKPKIRLPANGLSRIRCRLPGGDGRRRDAADGEDQGNAVRINCGRYASNTIKSAQFTRLEPNTRKVRRRILERFCQHKNSRGSSMATSPSALLEARHIRKVRDELAAKPEAANGMVKALRQLFAFATEYGLAERNPARDVSRIHTGSDGFHTWTPKRSGSSKSVIPSARRRAWRSRLMLYAGLRRSDAVALGRQHARGRESHFTVKRRTAIASR